MFSLKKRVFIVLMIVSISYLFATPLKKSGQGISYTKYDDGYYKAGVDHNYTRDDIYEIVIDNVTGLMWQDTSDVNTTTMTWSDANTTCTDLSLGGYSDWRVPTIAELETIVDDGRYNPALDIGTFQNFASSDYWSSTTNANYPDNAWLVSMSNGNTGYNFKTISFYVRCVRGGL